MGTAVPHPVLRPYVRGLFGYVDRRGGAPARRELPVPYAVLVLNLGPPLWLHQGGRWQCFPDGLLAGMDDASVLTDTHGLAHEGLQAMLTPLGAQRLAGVAMHELAHRSVALDDVLGGGWTALVDRLRATPAWPARMAAFQDALLRRLLAAPESPPDVTWAWRQLERSAGTVRVQDLAAELRCSPRHLQSRFRDHVGLAPKRAARLLRFSRAMSLLEAGSSQAETAARAGFSDQAHLSREVRRLTGLAPGALLDERRSDLFKTGPLPLA